MIKYLAGLEAKRRMPRKGANHGRIFPTVVLLEVSLEDRWYLFLLSSPAHFHILNSFLPVTALGGGAGWGGQEQDVHFTGGET